MKKNLAALAIPLLFSIGMTAGPVLADGHGNRLFIDRDVDTFAVLPQGITNPEGITANPANGDIYVSTFVAPFKLLRYNRHGKLLAQRDFGQPLLGLEFNGGKVYITNVGNFVGVDSKIQRVAADLSNLEDVAVLPHIGAPASPFAVGNPDGSTDLITFGDNASVPNALVFDSDGTLYISDSFQGAVFKIANVAGCNVATCVTITLSHDGLLATVGFPPFGANGLAFNTDESVLFVANTGDDRVLKIDPTTGGVSSFSESLNGADGLVFDKRSGLLWVCANQADEVVALNAGGRTVAKLGEFRGINRDGTPDGLLFPASPVIVGDDIFVTNLAIALGASADEPEAHVTRWTISRMRLPH
jgi:sugar lactone lactonase YvrE